MSVFRFLLFLSLLVGSNAFVKPQYNVTGQIDSALQRFFGITLPSLKIPDLLNPDKKRNPPSIQNRIPQGNLINIGLPTIKLPNLIPTALPVIKLPTIKIPNILPTLPTIKIIPTIKIPDIIPKNLSTLGPIKLPTIKLPTLPHILPTKSPKPTPSHKVTCHVHATPSFLMLLYF
ncbi:Leguminosin group485 secreted peptide [Caenorhabditis elegans]|uniref:Leguminosin group485 secreted peptide n=1 Tax=Caenorhabditis elegans TaxID=6239 RepID=A0A3B1DQA9_CAEEL|nr:Leguminosin group485 secreted peptide [Caenorhabditis elegans]VAY52143.1 Leguminosin group485 secreted peptide [Caenorhabditis elegans]|eukprot:NP_001355420.1 Saposin-like protein 11 [Caenorhabditis elegans]